MAVYRFKVYFEDDEAISREIEIKSSDNFEDFHKIIQKSIGFDSVHPASFYVSGDTWRKGKEITLLHKKPSGLKGTWMHETKIATYVEDPHQRFVYEFDPDGGNWVLLVELMKIIPDAGGVYPRVNKSTGAAPPQYKITAAEVAPIVEEEEDEETTVLDDSEDAYIHPEAEAEYEEAESDEAVPRHVVKEVASALPDEEAIEMAGTGDDEAVDEEDESLEQEDYT